MDPRDRAEAELRWWLVRQAEAGVPELVLEDLLREHAEVVAERGYVPRDWGCDPALVGPGHEP
ncbi:hypothetical protein ACKVMT_17375 [Halobacteriales archaeon Cl-PHB]